MRVNLTMKKKANKNMPKNFPLFPLFFSPRPHPLLLFTNFFFQLISSYSTHLKHHLIYCDLFSDITIILYCSPAPQKHPPLTANLGPENQNYLHKHFLNGADYLFTKKK